MGIISYALPTARESLARTWRRWGQAAGMTAASERELAAQDIERETLGSYPNNLPSSSGVELFPGIQHYICLWQTASYLNLDLTFFSWILCHTCMWHTTGHHDLDLTSFLVSDVTLYVTYNRIIILKIKVLPGLMEWRKQVVCILNDQSSRSHKI